MFRAIISPSSGALDRVYSLWYNAPTMLPAGDQFQPHPGHQQLAATCNNNEQQQYGKNNAEL